MYFPRDALQFVRFTIVQVNILNSLWTFGEMVRRKWKGSQININSPATKRIVVRIVPFENRVNKWRRKGWHDRFIPDLSRRHRAVEFYSRYTVIGRKRKWRNAKKFYFVRASGERFRSSRFICPCACHVSRKFSTTKLRETKEKSEQRTRINAGISQQISTRLRKTNQIVERR